MLTWSRTLIVSFSALVSFAASAAEVKAFVAEAFRPIMEAVAADFEKGTGHKLTASFGTAGALRDRLRGGEPADVVLLPRATFDQLLGEQKIAAGTEVAIAQTLIYVVTRAGAPKPDITSPEALKQTLLAARAIGYPDPARGGAVGAHGAWVVERLALAGQLKDRTRLTSGSEFRDSLASGEIELGFVPPTVVIADPRLQLVGPLPMELQNPGNFLFLAGATSGASDPAAARALVQYLASPAAAMVIKAKGMEPGRSP